MGGDRGCGVKDANGSSLIVDAQLYDRRRRCKWGCSVMACNCLCSGNV